MKLGSNVKIKITGVIGKVVGEYRYIVHPTSFMVRYADASNVVHEQWFTADELTTPQPAKAKAKR